jgi:ATP-binding cassette subfamily B protein
MTLSNHVLLARPQSLLLALAALLWMAMCAVPIAVGLTSQALFNQLSAPAPSTLNLWQLCALLFVLEASGIVITFRWLFWHMTLERGLHDAVQRRSIRWLLARPEASLAARNTGDALSRLTTDPERAVGMVKETYRIVGEVVIAGVALYIMISIDAYVALATVIPLTAVVLAVNALEGRIATAHRTAGRANAELNAFLSDALNGVQAVKVAAAEASIARAFLKLADALRHATFRTILLEQVVGAVSANLSGVSHGVVLVLGAQQLRSGAFSLGDLALFAIYAELIILLPRRLGRWMAIRPVAKESVARLLALMPGAGGRELVADSPVDEKLKLPPLTTLEVSDLVVLRPNGFGVHDVNFRVARGQLVVITGRIASGKTTLLEAILGQIPIEKGEVRWGDQKIEPNRDLVPPNAAYVAQSPRLFSETLDENIRLGWDAGTTDLNRALRVAVLEEDVTKFEQGLATTVGPRGTKLSGGQISRTAVARAAFRNAELLVLDDVSSALDARTEVELWRRMKASGAAMLAASHRRAAFEAADHVIVLANGRVVGAGRAAELLETCDEFRALWDSPASEASEPSEV